MSQREASEPETVLLKIIGQYECCQEEIRYFRPVTFLRAMYEGVRCKERLTALVFEIIWSHSPEDRPLAAHLPSIASYLEEVLAGSFEQRQNLGSVLENTAEELFCSFIIPCLPVL